MGSVKQRRSVIEQKRQFKSKRRKALAVLGCMVVVATAFALMMPAISVTQDQATQNQGFYQGVDQSPVVVGASVGTAGENANESAAASASGSANAAVSADELAVVNDVQQPQAGAASDTSSDDGADSEATSAGLGAGAGESEASDNGADTATTADNPDTADAASKSTPQTFEATLQDQRGRIVLTVEAEAPAGALPDGATMKVEKVVDESVLDTAKELGTEKIREATGAQDIEASQTKAVAVNITFADAEGNEVEPTKDVRVSFGAADVQEVVRDTPCDDAIAVVHLDDKRLAEMAGVEKVSDIDELHPVDVDAAKQCADVVEAAKVAVDRTGEKVAFEAASFSVYAVVYTVDFSYTPSDGDSGGSGGAGSGSSGGAATTFTYAISGGGATSLKALLAELGIAADDSSTEDVDELEAFVNGIAYVTFSSLDLLSVHEVDTNTTIGAIKQKLDLAPEYSASMTAEQIAAVDAQILEAPDWALISLKPFTSEEALTVTMHDGTQFTIAVSDAQEIPDSEATTIDVKKSYLICYEVNGVYYLLKNDGSVESGYHPDFEGDPDAEHDFEHLNSTYCWSFGYIFKEKDVETNLDKTYYLIRPIDNKSKTISLNNAGEALVQQSNNNVAVIQSDDGFILEGYHNIGTDEDHRYIHLGFTDGSFVGVDGEGVIVHIYEMDSLPTYDYTVRSSDETRGTVAVVGGIAQEVTEAGVVEHYYDATSNHDKVNAGTITAIPVDHRDAGGRNKWQFDYWELDGLPLDRDQYPATIAAEALPIPHNGSRLVAHFRQNPNYVVPNSEKEATTIENMTHWFDELQDRCIPLDATATKKTAEVYDYQNRMYRVDFTTKANFQTFDGSIDLAFCMDVSNSMKFPSKLVEASTNHDNPMPIYQINWSGWGWDNRNWLDRSRNYDNPYYLIADEAGTATVFKIYYEGGNWRAIDASRTSDEKSSKSFRIGDSFNTAWTDNETDKTHPFNAGDNNNTEYTIYDAGDGGRDRFYYLQESFKGGTGELDTITDLFHVAGSASPDVRVAYNTFHGSLGDYWKDFDSAAELNVEFRRTGGGGTRPDYAFEDLQGGTKYHWTAEEDNRYVVLITDGAPQSGGSTRITEAVNAANRIKQNLNVKIITVGLSMDDVEVGKRFLYDIADTDSNGEKMFYLAESGSDLQNIIRNITKTLMEDVVVFGDVTDTVGEAFYLVNKDTGLPLSPGDKIDIEGNLTTDDSLAAGVVQPDGKTVVWKDQAIDSINGWHGVAYAKAKEDLLGGNAVKTNDGEATVVATKYRAGGEDVLFDTTLVRDNLNLTVSMPSPRVNVNELTFFNNETEWTVYLGEEVDPKKQLKALYDSLVVEEVVNDDGSLHYTIDRNSIGERWDDSIGAAATFSLPGLIERLIRKDSVLESRYFNDSEFKWDVFLGDIGASGGIVLPYHEYGLADGGNIRITLEKTIADGEESDLIGKSPHKTTVEGGEVEKYTLRIAYEPDYTVTPVGQGGQSTEDFHTGTFGAMYQGHAAGRETSTNEHIINVIVAGLDINKQNESGATLTGEAMFKLYRKAAAGETPTKTLTVTVGTTTQQVGVVQIGDELSTTNGGDGTEAGFVEIPQLSGAADGAYYLEETKAPDGYNLLAEPLVIQLNLANTYNDIDGDAIPSAGIAAVPYNWVQSIDSLRYGANVPATDADNDGLYEIAVINNSGYELPSTGGPGTVFLYVLGGALIAFAIRVLTKRGQSLSG